MRMRPTGSAALVLAAMTLAVTAASPAPAQGFLFPLPLFQNQPSDTRQGRSPTDNRWRDDTAKPVKPSTSTKSRNDEAKSSSSSAAKGAKSSTKSEAKTNSAGQTSRSRNAKQEPATSKSSGRASTAAQRTSPSDSSASTSAQEASTADGGSNVGDILDEKLGEVFKARIDELLKQSPK